MRKQTKFAPMDVYLFGITLLLVTIGVWFVFDASYAKTVDAQSYHFDTWYFVKRQMIYAALGLFTMYLVSRVHLKAYLKCTWPLLLVSFALLVAVLIPGVGHKVWGASRWFKLGLISFQPSEIAKIAIVLFLAGALARRKSMVRRDITSLVQPLIFVCIVLGLIVIEDLGTGLVLALTSFIMLFIAGVRKRHLLGFATAGASLAGVMVLIQPYRLDRIRVWLDPWTKQYGDGYQIIHSLYALGTGGFKGVNLCEGREKFFLPAASTDFIFATVGEEAGLIGGLILLALFVLFAYRGLDIARRAKSEYANLLAVGVTSLIVLQALTNIAVVTASIPATGVPLPFISYGGSSLVTTLIGVGILLAVSRQADIEMEERDLYEDSFDGRRDRRTHIPRY